MKTNTKTALLLALPMLVGTAGLAAGEEVRMLDENTSVEQLRGYLAPDSPRRTRSIEIVGSLARPPVPSAGYVKAAATSAMPSMPAPAAQQPATEAAVTQPPVEEAPAAEAEAETAVRERPITIGYRIQFAFDSAEVLTSSRPFLDRLGQLLNEEADVALVVEGHTDARGSDAYNLALSKRRAEAVKAYLIRTWEVSADRLVVEGKGEAQPLAENGDDPENRRVQFRRVGA